MVLTSDEIRRRAFRVSHWIAALDRVDTLAQELALLQDKASDGSPSWQPRACCGGSLIEQARSSFRKRIRWLHPDLRA